MRVAIITASDRCSRGEAVDVSGPILVGLCQSQGWQVVMQEVLPDELSDLSTALRRAADELNADLTLTTGGTGLGPRDVTPEATLEVIHRLAPGVAEALRLESLKITPFAMLSRGTAGLRGRCLIVNLPGNPRAAMECFQVLLPVLPHAIAMMGGAGHQEKAPTKGAPGVGS